MSGKTAPLPTATTTTTTTVVREGGAEGVVAGPGGVDSWAGAVALGVVSGGDWSLGVGAGIAGWALAVAVGAAGAAILWHLRRPSQT